MASRREKNANGPSPGADDEEDDYMTMVIQDPIQKETSLQRAARLKREARERGFMKSKAQLAKEAEQAREKALSTSLFDAPRTQQSKGLAMMARMGFTGGGLGKQSGQGKPSGITEPISVTVKDNRGGIGLDAEKRRRAEESGEGQPAAKAAKLVDDIDPAAYRERMSRERLAEKLERQITAAQRVAATLDGIDIASEESEDERRPELRISKRRLKTLPKEYRSYIRRLQSEDREKRARIQRERAMLTSRFDRDLNGDEDDDDLTALGRKLEEYVEEEDLDDTDEELEEFISLDTDEQLRSVVVYLRKNHNYCFWCKMAYPDEDMEGCPGTTEEDHD